MPRIACIMKNEDISLNTKKKIAASLKKLMAKKDFDKITVKEILEDADVTRPTFYYHFEDIYDLMRWMFESELLIFMRNRRDLTDYKEAIRCMLEYVRENYRVCMCAYNSVGRDILYRLFSETASSNMHVYMQSMPEYGQAVAEDIEFINSFYTAALASTLIRWMHQGMKESPEHLIEHLRITMEGNIEEALHKSCLNKH